MDVHKNARTTPHSRALIAQRVAAGERPAAVARAVGVCDRTVHKWVARAAEGLLALEDRSCRPRHSPRALSAALMVEIERARYALLGQEEWGIFGDRRWGLLDGRWHTHPGALVQAAPERR